MKESQAVADIAEVLYDFLPGSGSNTWKGHVSFQSVADKVGVGDYWQPGSKTPMIVGLLERTLNYRRNLFESLILEIVRSGITYRKKRKNPIAPDDIDQLNGLIIEVGFKFPDLWDVEFKQSLATDGGKRAKANVDAALNEQRSAANKVKKRTTDLEQLKNEFFELFGQLDRRSAGFKLETILNRLFALHDLEPRKPFKVIGEQIDGSFDLDHETYLVEAKWTNDPIPESELLVFRGKVEGKSTFTRGIFVSINGYSDQAKGSIVRGKQPNFFTLDGYDLTMVLSDAVALNEFLRKRRRLLAEEGEVFVHYNELDKGSRKR